MAEASRSQRDPSPPRQLPGHAGTVVVPVANPSTAADLLALGAAFCEDGGLLLAVSVTIDDEDADLAAETSDALLEVVEEAAHAHPELRIELVARSSTSIARGIAELAREETAELILLGIGPREQTPRTAPPLGRIADAVIDIAPCDVVVLRPGHRGEHVVDLRSIVVTVDGSEQARTAAQTGIVLGDGLGLPVGLVHVQDRGHPRQEGLGVLAHSMDGVAGRELVRTRLLYGTDVAATVNACTEVTDLIVVGLRRGAGLRRWLFGSAARGLVREAESPVLVVARQAVGDRLPDRARRLADWLRPGLTKVEQETLRWNARRQATTTIDYVTLLGVSAVLATLGLVQNSVAVIIGAMLVAPLLGPLSAISIGLVTARISLLRRGAFTLAAGTVAAALVSLLVGLAIPLTGPTPQMLLRGRPSLLDVGVALASGLVGAFATARKDIPAALAGVAIAAALVPPISTIGLGVALGNAGLAGGALLLFLVNVASIVVASAAAFWWFGLRPVEQDHATRRRITAAALGAGMLFAVVTATTGLVEVQRADRAARLDVEQQLTLQDDIDLVDVEVARRGGLTIVTAIVRSERDLTMGELRTAEDQLARNLGTEVELRVVVQRVVTAPD